MNKRIERVIPRAGLKIRDQKGHVLSSAGEEREIDIFWIRSQSAGDVTLEPIKKNIEDQKNKDLKK